MAMQVDQEYLDTPDIFLTQLTPEQPVVTVEPRAKEIVYVIQPGDTLSGVGKKFGLKVATLKYRNDLTNADSLKPGQSLKIPVQDFSDRTLARLQTQEQAKKTTLAAFSRATVTRSGSYAPSGGGFIVPISHNGISRGLSSGHTGIDYRANVGTSIRASAAGRVVVADSFGWNGGWGKTILIDHGSGRTSRYAHLSSVNISTGDWVSQGEVIGLSGNTGRSTGPHLHFEVRVNSHAVVPF